MRDRVSNHDAHSIRFDTPLGFSTRAAVIFVKHLVKTESVIDVRACLNDYGNVSSAGTKRDGVPIISTCNRQRLRIIVRRLPL